MHLYAVILVVHYLISFTEHFGMAENTAARPDSPTIGAGFVDVSNEDLDRYFLILKIIYLVQAYS